MDLDAYTAVHRAEWDRLRVLVARRRLDGAEADELVRLYQTVATHLSSVRSAAPDPVLVAELSELLGRARSRLAGTHEASWEAVARFFVLSLPAALYRIRWWSYGVIAVSCLVALAVGTWVATSPDALAAMGTPSQREAYVDDAFAAYYEPGADFAVTVWTNNAWIAAQCVAFGITGLWPAYVLLQNAALVGATGGMMVSYGEGPLFFSLIAPHGLLELTAVFVAGAAGLRLFWTMIDPGPRPRGRALAAEGRALFTVAIGLALVLGVSGLVEGFVTGSSLAWWLKIAIGVVVLALFWVYVLVVGRRAARAGETGDLDPDEAGYEAPVAA
ncbi:putative membrane protein SpoIIM required for sporulation [Sediminihabitans luteus]|uniref:Putative membrane protein SpoIIM required for sporulation n=1 Tax=Sediminihabitans luteus TaxID=1138585 RepID=A0A2M9CDT2_9CELL|nr:stage II sporulation protein M [Sediminihabitans luteus]PJJ70010.1 putative membrane protein SpoIIM required for sporulation [Sediminihabitans luteus]GII99331.1 membrane protein [Sediminihabitans luteus]